METKSASSPSLVANVLTYFGDSKGRYSPLTTERASSECTSRRHYVFLLSALVAFVASSCGFFFLGRLSVSSSNITSYDKLCAAHMGYRSPIEDDLDITYHDTTFNASLLRPTIYREDPSPEVDKAWNDIGVTLGPVQISHEQALAAQIGTDYAKVSPKHGGGYIAFVETFHQLHCLASIRTQDTIRKTLYYNYDYYKEQNKIQPNEFYDGEPRLKNHTTHCLDVIRQQLMCTADTGLAGAFWLGLGSKPTVIPDFSHHRKCKNFDQIKEWTKVRQTPEMMIGLEPQKGELILSDWP